MDASPEGVPPARDAAPAANGAGPSEPRTQTPEPAPVPMSEPGTTNGSANGRAGRNLPAAIAVGLGLGALAIATLYTVKALFLIVVVAAVGIGVAEMVKALATRGIRVPLAPVLAGLAVMQAGAYWGGPASLVGAFAVTVFVLLGVRMFRGEQGYVRDASAAVLVAVYPALLAGFVALLLAPDDGRERVVVFLAVTVASDVGGYIAGVLFGRHAMAPAISPKKTWEGMAGSALACMLVGGWLVAWLLGGQVWKGALLGVVAAVFATLGDLVESVIKRDLGLKDLGAILPGHGGLMDRLDSLVATLIPTWVLLALLVG